MLYFCGEERCLVDAAGRIRLTQRFADGFQERGGGEVVLLGLPEGGIGVYPEAAYREMRQRELGDMDQLGHSFAARKSLRRFGLLSCPQEVSRQGRLTLPERLRDYAALTPGSEACVVGVEIGVEIWNRERLQREMEDIDAHLKAKCAREMEQDLQ